MKKKKLFKTFFIILGILVPFIVIAVLLRYDVAKTWESWGLHDSVFVYPNWSYLTLLLFKFSLYLFPPALIAIGLSIENKKQIKKKIYVQYLLGALNIWFLTLLIIKLFADSIFELDKIFGLTIFNSIKDVQTLIGYILTVILKKTIKVDVNQIYEKSSM